MKKIEVVLDEITEKNEQVRAFELIDIKTGNVLFYNDYVEDSNCHKSLADHVRIFRKECDERGHKCN